MTSLVAAVTRDAPNTCTSLCSDPLLTDVEGAAAAAGGFARDRVDGGGLPLLTVDGTLAGLGLLLLLLSLT